MFTKIMLFAALIITQVEVPKTASVSGAIVKFGTGEPLEGTTVELYRTLNGPGQDLGAQPHETLTDTAGKFVFRDVAPGNYRLVAYRNDGFVGAEYGQRSFNAPSGVLTLKAGDVVDGIRLTLTPTASISGRIRDADGEPRRRVRVQAMKVAYLADNDNESDLLILQAAYTNDLGEYRLFWLSPGEYIISAIQQDPRDYATPLVNLPNRAAITVTPNAPRMLREMLDDGTVRESVYVHTYYPGTVDEESAVPVTVRAGDELGGLELTLTPPIPTRRVTGRVIDGVTGQPAAARALVQISSTRRLHNPTIVKAYTENDGSFQISGILPGDYYLSTIATSTPPGLNLTAYTFLRIGAGFDIENLTITARRDVDLPVLVTFDGTVTRETAMSLIFETGFPNRIPYLPFPGITRRIGLDGMEPGERSRSLVFSDLRIAHYALNGLGVVGPRTAYIKSARYNGMDVLIGGLSVDGPPQGPLEIAIGTDLGSVSGVVRQENREPLRNAYVTLIPNRPNRHRFDLYRTVFTDVLGRFSIQGIAPGDYLMFAWEDVQRGAWGNSEFIESMERFGQPLRIGGAGTQDISVMAIPAEIQ